MIKSIFNLPCKDLINLNKSYKLYKKRFGNRIKIKAGKLENSIEVTLNINFIFEFFLNFFKKECGEDCLELYFEKVDSFCKENLGYQFEAIYKNWNLSDYLIDKRRKNE